MRVFPEYSPVRIARYVKCFFRGSFAIKGKGEFSFDFGNVIVDQIDDRVRLRICNEVNREILGMARVR